MPFSALENVRFLCVSTSTSTCAKSGEDHFLTSRSAISSAFLRLSLLSSSLVVDIDLLPRKNGDDKADALGKESGKKIIIISVFFVVTIVVVNSNALCRTDDPRLLRRRREESIVLSSKFTYILSITTDALFCADVALRTFRVLLEFEFSFEF